MSAATPVLMRIRAGAAEQRLGAAEVRCGFLDSGRGLPLLVEPRDVRLRTGTDHVLAWFFARLAAFEALLCEHGAVLLRGFALPDTAAFGRLTALHPPHAQGYVAGATPRAAIEGNVYESTRMAPAFRIGLHQEMAYMPAWPRLLAFYCREPPATGGETPLADMRAVTRRLTGDTLERFAARGVMYRRNFCLDAVPPPEHGGRRSGPEVYRPRVLDAFMTDDRARVEALCRERGLRWAWRADGSLTTTHVGPATVRHPGTGERVWFNQASTQHLNPRSVGSVAFAALSHAPGGRAAWPCDVLFGDGEPMHERDLWPVYDALDAEETRFAWQRGDLLWIDNVRVAHGRQPYRGNRDIQVALLD